MKGGEPASAAPAIVKGGAARGAAPTIGKGKAWRRLWAITPHERLRLRAMLDAIVAELYNLDHDDFAWILKECDHPAEKLRDKAFCRTLDPKGFWRVDKEKPPELRHTVLSQVAFRDLKAKIARTGGDRDKGIAAFSAQDDGDGWMLPDFLRLADQGLGHDARAQEPQPVRAAMGERFLDWQLNQSVEESWAECERHARKILGEEGFSRLRADIDGGEKVPEPGKRAEKKASRQRGLFGDDAPG